MKMIITYTNILAFSLFMTSYISCDKEIVENPEEFLYGAWNENLMNPGSIAFYYSEGFEFFRDGTVSPRYDHDKDGIFITNGDYVGSWSYDDSIKEITFKTGSKNPRILSLERISEDEIKLTNPVTKLEYLYHHE